jgi:hypothetical protein
MTGQQCSLIRCGRVPARNAMAFDPAADFNLGRQARTRIEPFAFDAASRMNLVHSTFNGAPERWDAVIGVMHGLRMRSATMTRTVADRCAGQAVAPGSEFVLTQGGMS